jgi:hypothetical protein
MMEVKDPLFSKAQIPDNANQLAVVFLRVC